MRERLSARPFVKRWRSGRILRAGAAFVVERNRLTPAPRPPRTKAEGQVVADSATKRVRAVCPSRKRFGWKQSSLAEFIPSDSGGLREPIRVGSSAWAHGRPWRAALGRGRRGVVIPREIRNRDRERAWHPFWSSEPRCAFRATSR